MDTMPIGSGAMRWTWVVGAVVAVAVLSGEATAGGSGCVGFELNLVGDRVEFVAGTPLPSGAAGSGYHGLCQRNSLYWRLTDGQRRSVLACGPVRDTRRCYYDPIDPTTGKISGGGSELLDKASTMVAVPVHPDGVHLEVLRGGARKADEPERPVLMTYDVSRYMTR